MAFEDINWSLLATNISSAAAGVAVATYAATRRVKKDARDDRVANKEERRTDNTVAFAETAWTGFIVKLEAEITRKDRELHDNRTEIARLEVALDKAQERIHNMLKWHVSGKDVLQTDVGLGEPHVHRIRTAD